ncbi:MAG: hypothetical protein LBC78_00070 [Oscillospiraceae bacterium]|jgi:hypothetical protein|nr:hypothetical protein [Oscillospiraceae bacterium]
MSFFGWSKKGKNTPPAWPANSRGEPEAAAFLCRTDGAGYELEIRRGLLTAYGIPTTSLHSGEGIVGAVIFGAPQGGSDIFVPESMLEDARALISAEISDDAEDAHE